MDPVSIWHYLALLGTRTFALDVRVELFGIKTCTLDVLVIFLLHYLGLFDHRRTSSEMGWDLRAYLGNIQGYLTMIPKSPDIF